MIRICPPLFSVVLTGLASSALAQEIPSQAQGSWDVSAEECRAPGTSVTQIDIAADRIDTYGGNAMVQEVERSGPVTFVAAAYLQTEGVPELGPREPAYLRLTQREGPDRLNLIWKGAQTVDLVRCEGETAGADSAEAEGGNTAGALPLVLGLWVLEGENCETPANAGWRIYDGDGIRGARSQSCKITAVSAEGNRNTIDQTCVAAYDGSSTTYRDTVVIESPKRFGLIEDGETERQDFTWCSLRMEP